MNSQVLINAFNRISRAAQKCPMSCEEHEDLKFALQLVATAISSIAPVPPAPVPVPTPEGEAK